jgi:hypothetical protein
MSETSDNVTNLHCLIANHNDTIDDDFCCSEEGLESGIETRMCEIILAWEKAGETLRSKERIIRLDPTAGLSTDPTAGLSADPTAGLSTDPVPKTMKGFTPSLTAKSKGVFTTQKARFCSIPSPSHDHSKPTNEAFLSKMRLGSHLSSAAYCTKPSNCFNFPIELRDRTLYNSDRIIAGERGIGVFFTYDSIDKLIRVIFRGTTSISQWMGNAKMAAYKCGENFGKAHRGFVSMYLGTRQEVWKHIDDLIREYPEHEGLQFTGHSLGGALAVLATCDFKHGIKVITIDGKQYAASNLFPFNPKVELPAVKLPSLTVTHVEEFKCPPIKALYTYGQPRVGNQQFVNNLSDLIGPNMYYRISHGDDIVCSLPPTALGFRSTGILVHFATGSAHDYQMDVSLENHNFLDNHPVQDLIAVAPEESAPNNGDRSNEIRDLLLPFVADHLYYVGVDYDDINHETVCTKKKRGCTCSIQ